MNHFPRFRLHRRFLAAFALGLGGSLALVGLDLTDRLLVGADLFFATYLGLTALVVGEMDAERLPGHVEDADEGIAILLAMVLGAVGVSLYAIVETLRLPPGSGLAIRPWLALAAVPLGWAAVHTVMAFHYAAIFYDSDNDDAGTPDRSARAGGLAFSGPDPAPRGAWDFLYYSFVLGMTAQTSDTGVTTARMRRVTLLHSVLCFFYNTVIVALAVNAALSGH